MEDKKCTCSETNRQTYGHRDVGEIRRCNNCQGIIDVDGSQVQEKPVKEEKESFSADTLDLRAQEELISRLVQHIGGIGKYNKALTKGEFAAFSLMGTNDWEDYASTVLRIMTLKESLRIDQNLEEIKKILIKIEKKL